MGIYLNFSHIYFCLEWNGWKILRKKYVAKKNLRRYTDLLQVKINLWRMLWMNCKMLQNDLVIDESLLKSSGNEKVNYRNEFKNWTTNDRIIKYSKWCY